MMVDDAMQEFTGIVSFLRLTTQMENQKVWETHFSSC